MTCDVTFLYLKCDFLLPDCNALKPPLLEHIFEKRLWHGLVSSSTGTTGGLGS